MKKLKKFKIDGLIDSKESSTLVGNSPIISVSGSCISWGVSDSVFIGHPFVDNPVMSNRHITENEDEHPPVSLGFFKKTAKSFVSLLRKATWGFWFFIASVLLN